jgi:hypothetical protein
LQKINKLLRVTNIWDDGEAPPQGNLANSAEKVTKERRLCAWISAETLPRLAFVVVQILDLLGDRDAGPAVRTGCSLDVVTAVVPFLPAVLAPQVYRIAYYFE